MKKNTSLWKWLPEIYLILATGHYWVNTEREFNAIAIILIILLSLVIITQDAKLGIATSFVFLLLSAYMILAGISDIFSENGDFNYQTRSFYYKVLTVFGINIVISSIMYTKWRARNNPIFKNTL